MQLIPINISRMIRTSLLCKLDSLIVVSLNFQDSGIPMINNMIMDVLQVVLVNQLNEFHILMVVVVAGTFGYIKKLRTIV